MSEKNTTKLNGKFVHRKTCVDILIFVYKFSLLMFLLFSFVS